MKAPNKQAKVLPGRAVLPSRAAMQQLDRSPRSLNDYAKVSPLRNDDPVPIVVQNMRKP